MGVALAVIVAAIGSLEVARRRFAAKYARESNEEYVCMY